MVTIARFIAGAAAYQNNDSKSSPNNMRKSCRTDVTTITVLKSMEVRQTKLWSTQANFLLPFRMEFVQFLPKPVLFTTSFGILSQCSLRGRSDLNNFLPNWHIFTPHESSWETYGMRHIQEKNSQSFSVYFSPSGSNLHCCSWRIHLPTGDSGHLGSQLKAHRNLHWIGLSDLLHCFNSRL